MAIAAGYGFTSTGWIGAALALAGLAIFLFTLSQRQRSLRLAAVACE
jgi:DHA1 family inner membrane transport protein